jgi:hypothetical protein
MSHKKVENVKLNCFCKKTKLEEEVLHSSIQKYKKIASPHEFIDLDCGIVTNGL